MFVGLRRAGRGPAAHHPPAPRRLRRHHPHPQGLRRHLQVHRLPGHRGRQPRRRHRRHRPRRHPRPHRLTPRPEGGGPPGAPRFPRKELTAMTSTAAYPQPRPAAGDGRRREQVPRPGAAVSPGTCWPTATPSPGHPPRPGAASPSAGTGRTASTPPTAAPAPRCSAPGTRSGRSSATASRSPSASPARHPGLRGRHRPPVPGRAVLRLLAVPPRLPHPARQQEPQADGHVPDARPGQGPARASQRPCPVPAPQRRGLVIFRRRRRAADPTTAGSRSTWTSGNTRLPRR